MYNCTSATSFFDAYLAGPYEKAFEILKGLKA